MNAGRLALVAALTLALAGCTTAPADAAADWQTLFDGASLQGMTPVQFGGEGSVHVAAGRLVLEPGSPLTGVTFATALPRCDYEIELVGARTQGTDFFCCLTFPTPAGCLSLVLGGWGGTVCGLSCLDGLDAASNDTRTLRHFGRGRDYTIRLAVRGAAVAVELDGAPFLHADLGGRACTVRTEVEPCQPFGLASYATRASFTAMRWRRTRRQSAPACARNRASSAARASAARSANSR